MQVSVSKNVIIGFEFRLGAVLANMLLLHLFFVLF